MDLNKKDVIRLLETIVTYLQLKGENPFRIRAYERAAQSLERDVRSLNEIDDFTSISGIGQGTNDLIVEFIETGKSKLLEELKETIPAGLIPLLQVPGLGGKRLATLYKEINVTDAASLRAVCKSGEIKTVRGFGDKTVENILSALEKSGSRPERLPIALMLDISEQIEKYLDTISNIERYSLAGSLRRLEETVKDIDFILIAKDRDEVREALISYNKVKEVIANGTTKVSLIVEAEYDVHVDFRLVEPEEYATTLHHFTGSKEHNVHMRRLAKQSDEKINEYGVEHEVGGETTQFATETAFFNHFGLHYIPPELRSGENELDIFKKDVRLLSIDDIRGDLHMHTTWSDGAQSIEEMIQQARFFGYNYIAITDHSKFLRVAHGLNETRLREQREEIDKLNEKYDDIHIFAGVEMDILPNGELDFPTEFLREMDIVIAAIHSGFNQTEEQIMNRLYTALDNPYVDIIAHPTGRIIGRREGYAVNVANLIKKASETGVVLELNANPHRFDLAPTWLAEAQEAGVQLAINTDAHQIGTFEHMSYGVQIARKAWLRKENVINTWTLTQMKEFLSRNK